MPTTELPPAGNPKEPELLRGALGLWAATFQGITHMAPAAGVILSAPFIATFAGPAMGLAFGLAGIAALLLANAVAQLAKHLPSAGGFFSYISRGLNPKVGFLAGWMYFLYDPIVPILCTVIVGGYAQDTLATQFGLTFPWWLYSIVVWIGLGIISYLGVKPSIRLMIILAVLEVGITLGLSFFIFAKHGVTTEDLSLGFTLKGITGASPVQGLFLGLVFSILSYTGFESIAPMAEETSNPKRTIPRAVMIGTAFIIGYYVIFGFATTVGFGSSRVAADFAATANPYYEISTSVWGQAGPLLILFALVNSGWGCALSGQSAVVRVYYKMAKIGVFPQAFGKLHATRRTPYIAIMAQTVFSIVVGIFCGITLGTVNTFGVLGAMVTFAMIFVYGCTLIAVPVFYLREHRDQFNVILHGILPFFGILVLIPVFYYNVNPFPPMPFRLAPIIAIGWFVIGIVLVLWLARTRPAQLEAAGKEIFEEA